MSSAAATQAAPAEPAQRIEQISELLRMLCLAESNIGMYSAQHPVARRFIKSAYDWLAQMIAQRKEPVSISMAEGQFVLDGLPIEVRNPMVAKFAKRLAELHVNTVFFKAGMTYEEFETFNAIISREPKDVNAEGGLEKHLKDAGVKGVAMQDVSYVMVREDEKIVSRDAMVVDGAILEGTSADSAMVESLVKEVLKRADAEKWLLTETKNNPKQMADKIMQGMEIAIARSDGNVDTQEDMLRTLLDNIRLVGVNLVDEQSGQIKDGQEDLEHAVLTLEKEIRNRSQKLMTSGAAAAFIGEVMNVITSFSDRVKSKQITQEFLKGEHSLKRAEKLLRAVVGQTEAPSGFLERVHDELIQHGMSEEEFQKLVADTEKTGTAATPAPARKRKKTFPKAVEDGILQRVKEMGIEEKDVPRVVEKLSVFVDNKVKEKEKEFQHQVKRLNSRVAARDAIIESVDSGIVLWDSEHVVDMVNTSAAQNALLKAGDTIEPRLLEQFGSGAFPIANVGAAFPDSAGWTEQQRQLLKSVADVIKDKKGQSVGLILGR